MTSTIESNAFQSMRPVAAVGVAIALAFFGGLGAWAAIAPLDSAAIAPGVLSVVTNRKTIAHLEGGIVAEIGVAEGDRVAAGQPLVRLDDTRARATLDQLEARYQAARALEARLIAERDGAEEIDFPPDLFNGRAARIAAEAVAGEISIFEARRRLLEGQAGILRQRIVQFEKEIEGVRGAIAAETTQIALIEQELSAQKTLVSQKLASMPRMVELQRDQAELRGSRARNVAAIARVEQTIAEERLKILELGTGRVNDVVEALRDTQAGLLDLEERIRTGAHVLERTVVLSPLDGIVVDLRVHTVGGIVAPGETLMDVVPADDPLVVKARVTPEDIDSVHAGLTAQVAVTAFSRRNVSPIEGSVMSVSADRLTDERTGQPYFLARIALPQNPYADTPGLALYPGMQADVMIVTGERTALDYLFMPVVRSFGRALRED